MPTEPEIPITHESRDAIHIANEVLADLAGLAALECYGIVGMAAPTKAQGMVQRLTRERLRNGVRISTTDEGVEIDLYVVVEHGTNIAEISKNLVDRVKYVLATVADLVPTRVEVHVQDMKVHP